VASTSKQKDAVVHDPFDPRCWGPMLGRMLLVMLVVASGVVALAFYQHHRGRRELGSAGSPLEAPSAPATSPASPPPAMPFPPSAAGTGGAAATGPETPLPPPQAAAPTVAQPVAPEGGQAAKPEKDAAAKPEKDAAAKPEADSAATPEIVADPNKQEIFRRELVAARAAIAKHDFAAARRRVGAATAQAQTPAEQSEAARAGLLLANLQEFWKGIAQVVAGLTVAQEISAGQAQYIVVSVTRDKLTLRTEGRSRTYDLKNLPRPVVEALARSGFAAHASSKILLGTYLALDPRGDRREARRLWEEARQEGEDVGALMAELEGPLGASAGAGGASKMPPPSDAAKLQEIRQAVRARFQPDYDRAASTAGKAALARKLLDAARATPDTPEALFTILAEARDVAVAAAKPALALEAIDAVDQSFQVDPLGMKLEAIEQMAKAVRSAVGHREIAESALGLFERAAVAGRPDEAGRAAKVAVAAAKGSGNPALLKKARAALEQARPSRPQGPEEKGP